MSKVPSVIEELAIPIVEELNLELVDIEFVKEGRNWFLRIYVDTPEVESTLTNVLKLVNDLVYCWMKKIRLHKTII